MGEPRNVHDALFKIGFGTRDAARSQLRALLPEPLLASLDLDRLEPGPDKFIDPEFYEYESDRLFSVGLRGREALVYVLHEHQSTPVPLMGLRLLRYLVRIWDSWLADHPNAKRLPAIIPIVLYHGAKSWDAPTEFQELLDLPADALAAVGHHLPKFEFVLDDLSLRTDEELRARQAPPLAAMTLLLFKHGRQGEDLLAVWRDSSDLVALLVQQEDWSLGLEAAARYTLRVGDMSPDDLARVVQEAGGAEAKEVVVSTAERLEQSGVIKGLQMALMRQARRRFGEVPKDAEERIARASEEDLVRWLDLVLTAATLDALFEAPAVSNVN